MYATLTLPAGQDHTSLPPAPTVQVRSVDEIRKAVQRARAQALTLDASGMDRILRVDTAQGLLEVQAATTWTELTRYLAGHGMALDEFTRLRGLPATVGEAVSLASPGPDGLPVPAHVMAATMVTPEGELRCTGRDSNPEMLKALLGGQGLLGVLYSLTLSTASLRRSAQNPAMPVDLEIAQGEAVAPAGSIECLLPPAELDAYLNEVRLLLDERRLALRGITVRRYLPDPSCMLKWATREWAGVEIRFSVKAILGASVSAAEVRRALLTAALARGGSFPIRDMRDATRRQLETCYPTLGEFLAEKRRADPSERLQNNWYRRIGARLRAESCEVRWNRS